MKLKSAFNLLRIVKHATNPHNAIGDRLNFFCYRTPSINPPYCNPRDPTVPCRVAEVVLLAHGVDAEDERAPEEDAAPPRGRRLEYGYCIFIVRCGILGVVWNGIRLVWG